MISQQLIKSIIEKGILVSPDLDSENFSDELIKEVISFFGQDLDVLDAELVRNYKLRHFKEDTHDALPVEILQSYSTPPRKRSYDDFVAIFNMRYKNIASILKKRRELQQVSSIKRVKSKPSGEKTSIIAMILDKKTTKNNSLIFEVEDTTGKTTVIIKDDERNKELHEMASDVVLDEVVGITGTWLNGALFADNIVLPDVPITKELKKQAEEEYAIALGDTHFGSRKFLRDEFSKFIKWIRGEMGSNEQKMLAKKTKYVILTGDIVEGVGIYPDQEENLEIPTIKAQYDEAARWLSMIPDDKFIIIQSGDHDAGRISEPQETPFKDFASALWALPNTTLVSNPAYLKIGKKQGFPGFDLLIYHGRSLIYYSQNVPSIRSAGGQKRCDLILKFLLQRRHLAPTHGSTLYVPDPEKDYLLIDPVPDIFITGHIHRSSVSSYRNVTLINASCWTGTSEDQIKRGLQPLPARLPLINLRTREVKVLNFLTKKTRAEEEEKIKGVKALSEAEQ